MPRVSVIIPSYNHARYVGDAVESVLTQDSLDVEIIVVDDGSTDSTQNVLQKYSSAAVRVIRQTNKGLLGARNRGILESSAPILCFLDADDLLLPGSLHFLLNVLDKQPEVGLVTGGRVSVDSNGNKLVSNLLKPNNLQVEDLLVDNPIIPSGVMVRRNWLDIVGGFETKREFDPTGDWDLWVRLAYMNCKIEWVEKPVVAYRVHMDQMSQDPSRMRHAMLLVLDKFYANTRIPQLLEDLKPRAYGNLYVRSACKYFLAGMHGSGANDLDNAIRLNPIFSKSDYKELTNLLIGWAQSPQSKDPVSFLENIRRNLPTQLKGLDNPLKKAIASIMLKPIFNRNSQTSRRSTKWKIIKAVQYDHSLLLNRGVIRLFVEAWIPIVGKKKGTG
jgi:glycosyltransferase involved in cell wall biosynthesis